MSNTRKAAYLRGRRAERIAAVYLRLKGYTILEKRYKTPVGEIDIVACKERKRALVMTEVKIRDTRSEALESVTPRAQKRIVRAGEHFISMNPAYTAFDVRFDVITFTGGPLWPFSLSHLDNAWRVEA